MITRVDVLLHKYAELTNVFICVFFSCSSAVVVVWGAGSSPPAASSEEQAERTTGKSSHAAQHEQHEAWPHTQVSYMCENVFLSKEQRRMVKKISKKEKKVATKTFYQLWSKGKKKISCCSAKSQNHWGRSKRGFIWGGEANQQWCEVIFLKNIVCSCFSFPLRENPGISYECCLPPLRIFGGILCLLWGNIEHVVHSKN